MKTKRSKATDIPMSVKKKVWERDNGCCEYSAKHYQTHYYFIKMCWECVSK